MRTASQPHLDDPINSIRRSVRVRIDISCGCGASFNVDSLHDAIDHCVVTGHTISSIRGEIRRGDKS